ncbi:hypothetical protein CGRA01v4_01700 [Colletotrichum graminicola]|nr:hypothetical protein CGRA01v4_01700 [Colletotrichum graminicola]
MAHHHQQPSVGPYITSTTQPSVSFPAPSSLGADEYNKLCSINKDRHTKMAGGLLLLGFFADRSRAEIARNMPSTS